MNGFDIDKDKKLIKLAEDPLACFEENPLMMVRAVRTAAESGFDIHTKTYEAILQKSRRLKDLGADGIREEFETILTAEFCGKGLRMLAGADLMPYIIGGLAEKMTKRALNQFAVLAENIDKTKRVKERRIALFYLVFEKKEALAAMKLLEFDEKTVNHVILAHDMLESMCFIGNKQELKKFMARCGAERYEYLDGLSKAQRIVYDMPESKILSRHYLLLDIRARGEPIFIEDLAIDKKDITDRKIAEGAKAEQLLHDLLSLVHKNPKLNTREYLLREAEKTPKDAFRMTLNRVRWLK